MADRLTHVDETGAARMVDVSDKANPQFESYYPVPTNGVHTAVVYDMDGRTIVSIQTYDWVPPGGIPVDAVPQQNAPMTQRIEITELKPDAAGTMTLQRLGMYSHPRPTTDQLALYFPHDSYIQKHPITGKTYLYVAYWDAGAPPYRWNEIMIDLLLATPDPRYRVISYVNLAMHDALRVDLPASLAAYREFHRDWPARVDAEAREFDRLGIDAVFSNVGYLPLAATLAGAGIAYRHAPELGGRRSGERNTRMPSSGSVGPGARWRSRRCSRTAPTAPPAPRCRPRPWAAPTRPAGVPPPAARRPPRRTRTAWRIRRW